MKPQITLDSEDIFLQIKNYIEIYSVVLSETEKKVLEKAKDVLLDRFL